MNLPAIFKKLTLVLLFLTSPYLFSSCELLNVDGELTTEQVIEGLKEALKVGTVNSVTETNRTDGYFGNSLIKIPFPPEAQGAETFMKNNSYLSPLLSEFILKVNRAAEDASIKAKPIFINAITGITFEDAWNILKGDKNAATNFLHNRTYTSLYDAFKPDINTSLSSVGATQAWNTLTSYYNNLASVPFSGLQPVNTDLPDYATKKALDGLFTLVQKEEEKIRIDPAARVSEILKKVFAQQD